MTRAQVFRFAQSYAVLVLIVALIVTLTVLSDSFLTVRNLLNILNQNAPLAPGNRTARAYPGSYP